MSENNLLFLIYDFDIKKTLYILNYCKLTNLQGERLMVLNNPSIMHKINIFKIDTKEIRKGNDNDIMMDHQYRIFHQVQSTWKATWRLTFNKVEEQHPITLTVIFLLAGTDGRI